MADKYDFRKMDNIRVICRFRPKSDTEKREEKKQSMENNEPKFRSVQEVVLKRPKGGKTTPFKAVLDHMFRPSTTQKKIFDLIGRPMVQAVLEGYNATIFAYGQTGSGKTFTMFGPEKRKDELNLGLVQRCCTYLFDKLKKLSNGVDPDVVEWHVSASFIQIYKERLSDLLDPKQTSRLQIRTNFQTDTPYVENLKNVSLNNIEDVLINLSVAFSNRIVASHKLNSESSRSHMLMSLVVEQKTKEGAVKRSKLNFGDLAGSEDIRRALGDNPDPERMKEAIAINSSLTALTTAINNLSKGQRPSYRSSALTHILQDSLGGNSKTTMIVAASPAVFNRAETIRTLRFAMTAKTVTNKAKINKEFTRAQLMRRITELEAQNAQLKSRVIELETQMQAAGMDVVLSTDLYGDEDALDWSSGDDDDDDGGGRKKKRKKKGQKGQIAETGSAAKANGNDKKGKGGKKGKKGKAANLSIESGDGVNKVSSHQIDILKKEIDHLNSSLKSQTGRNKDLEKRTIDLSAEIDSVTQQLQSTRETLDQTNKKATNFSKERQQLEARVDALRKEMQQNQAAYSKQQNDLDKQIQRQRNNITMQISEKKDLQKSAKELNLQNEELLKQNDLLENQMRALKQQAFKNNPEMAQKAFANDEATQKLIKELDSMDLKEIEENMEPADLLLYRFAASEANDFRLTPQQRMKKTAKMMNDLSTDINDLMTQWLPKKKNIKDGRKVSSALVFNVRALIGHFNVLVGQMKMNEANFQNDLKLDIRRRDQEIKKLKEENKLVHQLQDDMAEKDAIILQLKKSRDDLKVERDHLEAQTDEQRDMIFDVQNQVRYLDAELNKNRQTIVELKKKKVATADDMNSGLDLLEIRDGEEPDSSGSSDDEDEYEAPKNNHSKKSSNTAPKHYKQDSDEIIELSSEHGNGNINGAKHKNNNASVIIHDDADEKGDYENDQYSPINMNDSSMQRKPSKKRRKSTQSMWRENLKPGDQLDCKDESGLWWTAKIVGFKGNSGNRLQIRYDGWGDQYDEVIDRSSDRLAVYKSKFHTKKGGKKLIREGMMQKEGKMFKTWRKRYFTLDDTGAMSYYHNKGDENSIGSFDVKLMKRTERASFGRNKQYGLCLHTENRVWKFLCSNEKDLAEWIHAINFVKRGQFEEDD